MWCGHKNSNQVFLSQNFIIGIFLFLNSIKQIECVFVVCMHVCISVLSMFYSASQLRCYFALVD